MTLDEIRNFIKDNPEILNDLMDSATLNQLITTGHKDLQSLIDKSVAKGIDGFKQKGMVSILEAKKGEFYQEFAKENNIELDPRINELTKQVKELREFNERIEKENKINAKRADITAKLVEKGLNPNLVNFLHLEKEDVDGDVENLTNLVNQVVDQKVNDKLRSTKTVPDESKNSDNQKNPYSKKSWNLTEQAKLETNEPDKAKLLKAQAE